MINKAIAAGIVLAFLGAVRPDPEPSLVGVGIVALLIYESSLFIIRFSTKVKRKRRKDRYITVSKQDIKRWADERLFWPLEEVS